MRKRLVKLEGCLNFRDLGGYPTESGSTVRWGQLYRADGLQNLSTADVQHLRDDVGLGDIIDLRSSQELELDGRGLLKAEQIRFHHLPLFDGNRTGSGNGTAKRAAAPPVASLAELYLGMAEHAKGPIGKVIATLAQTDTPAVYHCAAGKDRTGVISAVILGLLGVADEIIVADYAATQENLDAIVARLKSSDGYQHVWDELPPDTLHANPETMIAMLAGVEARYGGMEGYAGEAGVTKAELEALRNRLLEPAGE